MALHITHVVLAEKVYNKYFKDKNKEKFYVGIQFPDIRYFAQVERNKTHINNLSLSEIRKKESFEAGIRFHHLSDWAREVFVESKGIYKIVPKDRAGSFVIKVIEDQVLYDKIRSWSLFANYLDNILSEEQSFGIDIKVIKRYHKIVATYLSRKPDKKVFDEYSNNMGLPQDMHRSIFDLYDQVRSYEKILNTIDQLYNNFEEIISEYE